MIYAKNERSGSNKKCCSFKWIHLQRNENVGVKYKFKLQFLCMNELLYNIRKMNYRLEKRVSYFAFHCRIKMKYLN
jgi:hypothetical protein